MQYAYVVFDIHIVMYVITYKMKDKNFNIEVKQTLYTLAEGKKIIRF